MKIKENYMLRKVSDTYVVVPVGDEVAKFNGMVNLNETGALLWQCLEKDVEAKDLVAVLAERYEVDEQTAQRDIEAFLTELKESNLLI